MYGNNWIAKDKTIFYFFQARTADFVDQLLKKCKQCKGPLTSVSEIKVLIDAKSPDLKTFLRQEIQYQHITHHRDAEVRKELCKVNNVSLEDMIENLTVMLSDEQNNEGVVFPSEEEVINILKRNLSLPVTQPEVNDAVCLLPNQPVAVIWDSKHKKKWYVGFFLDMYKDGTYRIDLLEKKGSTDKLWCRPSAWYDILDTEEIQMLPVNVVRDWNFKQEKPTFIITNTIEI